MNAPQPRPSGRIYALAIDDHNVHCMTESLLDTWWSSLDPEDKADLYVLHLNTTTGENNGGTDN